MDRVRALVEKLNAQLHQNEDKAILMITAQQILTELGGAVVAKPLPQNIYQEKTMVAAAEEAVMQVQNTPELSTVTNIVEAHETTEEVIGQNLVASIVEVNETPAADILEAPIVEVKQTSLVEVNEVKEVKDHLVLEPIKDLRSVIGINDKFQFIQELFGGDEKLFEVSIKTINAFKIFPEAQFYIKRELREKNNWDDESNVVKQFDQLVKRRFS